MVLSKTPIDGMLRTFEKVRKIASAGILRSLKSPFVSSGGPHFSFFVNGATTAGVNGNLRHTITPRSKPLGFHGRILTFQYVLNQMVRWNPYHCVRVFEKWHFYIFFMHDVFLVCVLIIPVRTQPASCSQRRILIGCANEIYPPAVGSGLKTKTAPTLWVFQVEWANCPTTLLDFV